VTGRALLILLLCSSGAWAQARLTAELQRDSIYEGESVTYSVMLHDADADVEPDLSALEKDFAVEQGGTSSQTQYVNGQMSRQLVFNYRLTPARAGKLTVPPATITVKGKTLRTPSLTLHVVAPEKQDVVVVEVETDRASVYPLQEFTVTLRIRVHKLPGKNDDLDPVLYVNPPLLRIPWVETPDGLETGTISDWLSPKLSRRDRGFRINELHRQSGGFNFFGDQRAAAFDLGGRAEGDYYVYELARTFRPVRTGRYVFGKVVLKGRFANRLIGRRFTGRDIHTVSEPVVVIVKTPPAAGKPAAFTGGIGRFNVRAAVQPRKVRVGDPMTLTVTVTGRGNIEEIGPPQLTGFDKEFRVHDGTAATRDGARVFTYSLRAARKDVRAVPPVVFAYFDVEHERYVSKATDALPIEVEEAQRLDQSRIESGGAAASRLRARGKELFDNDSDVTALRDARVRPGRHAMLLAALLLIYIAGSLGIARVQRLRADPALLRRRGAAARARRRLADGDDALEVFAGLVADTDGIAEGGLTAREVVARLRVEQETAARVHRLLHDVEGSRFGAGDVPAHGVAALLDLVLKEMGR